MEPLEIIVGLGIQKCIQFRQIHFFQQRVTITGNFPLLQYLSRFFRKPTVPDPEQKPIHVFHPIPESRTLPFNHKEKSDHCNTL